MLQIFKLGQVYESHSVFQALFHLGKRPHTIRIICPRISEVEIEDFSFVKTIERLLTSGTIVTIVTDDFLGIKRNLENRMSFLQNNLKDGHIRSNVYDRLARNIRRRLEKMEKVEKLFRSLASRNAKIFRQRRIHAKIVVVESTQDKVALVMSANITPSGLGRNLEVGVFFDDQNCINTLDKYIEGIIDLRSTEAYVV